MEWHMSEQLIKTVDESAEEEIQRILEEAEARAERIREEADAEGMKLKQLHLEHWKNAGALERISVVAAREKARLELLQIKEEFFEAVFLRAEEEIASFRESPEYETFLKAATREALSLLDHDAAILHIDPADQDLFSRIKTDTGLNHDVIADIETPGGLIAMTPDESIAVDNTLESRLAKSRELLRKEIFSILEGG
ncbi:MAG: hypothetical protein D5R99_02030 [Methanocalculus sp. MSAO_Arc1]|uniref:V-type ATP synthase subunit E n=2 Tax=Methanocalculus TaxID=71151 RepID=UPI000FEE169D|nr:MULTISPECIES: V-type ATP synthase subunit E family protein [unclassified Methanocalculus]MCP1662362.1 vacuolar-type H+-ATPase subunit E/Vma4 [Methanocalculus sp. AMF5]RQD81542.1 MAG: hypothetical protein D5R99_02030 [Methanocalculus sp. MSAO_Arc1]